MGATILSAESCTMVSVDGERKGAVLESDDEFNASCFGL
jgi:hypothetical protein